METSPVNEIKNKLDIVEVIRESIPQLKPAGTNWKGLCPFHNEKTPSFMVSQDKQIWHCFGCNEGGDMFTFVMKINGLEFVDALRMLADKAGVTLRRTDPQFATLRNKVLDMHLWACDFFQRLLPLESGNAVYNYLQERGIEKNTVKEVGLGQAPNKYKWDELYQQLLGKGFTAREILASGLIVKNKEGRYYDRFRNRLMFPLINMQGQVIGFAGRLLSKDAEQAKYINSPQTILYNKSEFLYGLHLARKYIRDLDYVIVVEGYFDWISLWQAGFRNVIAVSGTALTRQHLMILKRYTGNILFAFDADDAGVMALKRAVASALATECNVYTIDYSKAPSKFKDPDELVRHESEIWAKLLKNKVLALDYYLSLLFDNLSTENVVAKKMALKEYLFLLKNTAHAIDREHFLKKLSYKIDISIHILQEELTKVRADDEHFYSDETPSTEQSSAEESIEPRAARSWRWLALLMQNPPMLDRVVEKIIPEQIIEKEISDIYRELIIVLKDKGSSADFSYKRFSKKLNRKHFLDIWIMKVEELYSDFSEEDIAQELVLITARIKEEYFRDELNKLTKEIGDAEREHNQRKLTLLLKKHTAITDELANLIK